MKTKIISLAVGFFTLMQTVVAQAPQPPEIAAKGYILLDLSSKQILAESADINARVEPASLTKLMTGYLTFEALHNGKINLQQKFAVSERAWRTPGSRMFIDPKMQVPVEDLLKGMIVQSGNDATVALAEGVGGSYENFVTMMNQKAQQLHLSNTQYKNPEGLTEAGHYTSVKDLSILAASLIYNYPEYLQYSSLKEYRYPNTPESNRFNRNLLLGWDPSVDGLKTGHTEAAGYCLVATAKREQNGVPRRLLSVVVGAASEKSRAQESQKLLNWGYMAYDNTLLAKGGEQLETVGVWKGRDNYVGATVKEDVVLSLPANQEHQVEKELQLNGKLTAAISKGQVLGYLLVKVDGKVVKKAEVVAMQAVERAGFFKRLWHGFLMLFS